MTFFEKQCEKMIGKKFGHLTVLGFFGRSGDDLLWRCRCDCTAKTLRILKTYSLLRKQSATVRPPTITCGRGCEWNLLPRLQDLPLKKVLSPPGRDWVSFEVKDRKGVIREITIDRKSLARVGRYRWFAGRHRYTFYVHATGGNGAILMHLLILGLKKGNRKEGDHWDGNGLNNTLRIDGVGNLQRVTRSENNQNMARRKRCYPLGVYRESKKWLAVAQIKGKPTRLGLFRTMKEAAAVALEARKKHFPHFNPERIYK